MSELQNHVPILITGAGQRIGLHLAQRLIELGQTVIFTYRTRHAGVDELESKGAQSYYADFSHAQGVQDFLTQLLKHHHALRAIVHNASLWENDPLEETEAFFSKQMHVHVYAPWQINTACAPLLQCSHKADIVHITDDAVRKGSIQRKIYCAAKAALENLTLSFAQDLAPHIKVNAIAPALIQFNTWDDAAYQSQALKRSLLEIEPGPEVVFQTLWYLLENPYITGVTLPLNGGRHITPISRS